MTKELLIIFTRNPELGKCKTRLAATIGDVAALEIYKYLLAHTASITEDLLVHKEVHYSDEIHHNDIWNDSIFRKKSQKGYDLGERMKNAFKAGFKDGYDKIIIIGSDMYDLSPQDLEHAFTALSVNDYVLGPAEDGGYYLLGMKKLNNSLFENKKWGTNTVLNDTLNNLLNENIELLPFRNDIDYYEDIKDIRVFDQFLDKTEK
tara:strand:- start:48254 stop:48868 length:615 start_codon:yes stop_codon:yes gene_type:complete